MTSSHDDDLEDWRMPVDDLDAADQLKRDLAYERRHWDECAATFCTDFERYNDLLADILDISPDSPVLGRGGDARDAVIKELLRGLPVTHRLVTEYCSGLWDGSGYTPRVVAAALGLSEERVTAVRSESLELLRVHRDELLSGLARATSVR